MSLDRSLSFMYLKQQSDRLMKVEHPPAPPPAPTELRTFPPLQPRVLSQQRLLFRPVDRCHRPVHSSLTGPSFGELPSVTRLHLSAFVSVSLCVCVCLSPVTERASVFFFTLCDVVVTPTLLVYFAWLLPSRLLSHTPALKEAEAINKDPPPDDDDIQA